MTHLHLEQKITFCSGPLLSVMKQDTRTWFFLSCTLNLKCLLKFISYIHHRPHSNHHTRCSTFIYNIKLDFRNMFSFLCTCIPVHCSISTNWMVLILVVPRLFPFHWINFSVYCNAYSWGVILALTERWKFHTCTIYSFVYCKYHFEFLKFLYWFFS